MPFRVSILSGVVLLLAAAILDWLTGPEIASAIFYLPAILWMAGKGGQWPGLGTAVGTPVFRVLGMVGWTPLPAAPAPEVESKGEAEAKNKTKDRDNDGIPDDIDACPDTPGQPNADPTKDGCPPSDRDKDGIPDSEDACPTVPGVHNMDATKNGCPEDRDGDAIADSVDACPDVPGVASDDPKKNGCPADSDGDGIPDNVDACPNVKGEKHPDPKQNGCPEDPDGDGIKWGDDACPDVKGVPSADPRRNGCPKDAPAPAHVQTVVAPAAVAGETEVGTHVLFRTSRSSLGDVISPLTDDLVRAVREGLAQPDVAMIEVQGHTDDSGEDGVNSKTSDQRAETIRTWLIAKGIPADKLVAKGYSWSRPVADNRIRQGRQENRRVQFVLIKTK